MACENLRIAFIGAGRMGEALIRGLIRSGADPAKITAADRDAARLASLAEKHGLTAAPSNADAAAGADAVILAVKPKDVPDALAGLKNALKVKTLLISIAAGVNIKTLAAGLPAGARVVRVMPNAPAEKDAAISAIAAGPNATEADIKTAGEVFSAVGLTVTVKESDMNAVTAVSGSGPAYFYLFVKALTDAGVQVGLDRETAYKLAHETMFGASRMLKYSKKTPAELIDIVRSPGGTTAAALDIFDERGFVSIVEDAVRAASDRGVEIERELEEKGTAD
ncbi:MAG: pyrroline-5-carboxylate reductase [Actinomycetota bacterium]